MAVDFGRSSAYNPLTMVRSFLKMHGLGNDFVVLDARTAPCDLSEAQARALADRRTGIGCDQLVLIEPPRTFGTAAFMRLRNADGGEVAACGNATRCVALLLMRESGQSAVTLETAAGLLTATAAADGQVTVDMGPARLDWREIPLAVPADTLHLEIAEGGLSDPVAVGMGNPHAVFLVPDAEAVPLARVDVHQVDEGGREQGRVERVEISARPVEERGERRAVAPRGNHDAGQRRCRDPRHVLHDRVHRDRREGSEL